MILICRANKGATLEQAAADALAVAKRLQVDVEFEYGGLRVRIPPTDTPQKAISRAQATARIKRETDPAASALKIKRAGG